MDSTAPWLAADGLLAQFGRQRERARQRYAQFVEEGNIPSPWANLRCQVYLGDEAFVQRMQGLLQSGKDDVQIPLAQRRPPPSPLEEIEHRAPDRNAAIIAAYATGGYSYQQLAE